MILLDNGTLRVEMCTPGEHPSDGSRFDRAGFITEVVLKNEMHFCASENRNNNHPTTHGRGLCCEFRYNGWADAKVGERYPKIGVGLILKEDEESYAFYKKYDIHPYPVEWTETENAVEFRTGALPCCGVAVTQYKKISIEGNTLTIDCELTNVGEKPLETGEYCHNFINIDGYAIGPEYRLDLPCMKDFGHEAVINRYTQAPSNLIADGKGFTFSGYDGKIIITSVSTDGMSSEMPFRWSLSNKAAKAGIYAEDFYTPSSVTFWITDHLFSPEFIQTISLAPGETAKWTRKMTFTDEYE